MNERRVANHTMPDVSRNIRRALKGQRRLQLEIAKDTGIAYQTINRMLNGRQPLYLDEIAQIARALGVSVDSLLKEETE